MKFNSQICTTKEQSERLLALGLKKETADCNVMQTIRGEMYHIGFSMHRYIDYYFRYGREHNYQPAWSLHRLIEIANLPQYWECISGNWYEEVIATIQSKIHIGELNKEYLKE